MYTYGGGEVGTSQSQSICKKGHIMIIYLTDSDEEAIVDFGIMRSSMTISISNLKTKPGRNACRRGLLVAKNIFESVQDFVLHVKGLATKTRTHSKCGQAPKEMTERQNLIQD